MKALVIYDSWFGNTQQIAEAVVDGLGKGAQAAPIYDAADIDLENQDIIIVGSPTHGGMPTPAVQAFLSQIQDGSLKGIYVSAFDTRVPSVWVKIIGFADKRIIEALRKAGGCTLGTSKGFIVDGKQGPLKKGEQKRARAWAGELAHLWHESRAPLLL